MVFSSLYFAFFFLPIVVALYYIAKEPYRNYILLAASLYFYSYGEPQFVLVMLASILLNYMLALGINHAGNQNTDNAKVEKITIKTNYSPSEMEEKDHINADFHSQCGGAKLLLLIDIVANIGLLFVYKYLDFAITSCNRLFGTDISPVGITLPIGISFFTFQAMSYVIDVYRKSVQVQKNPLDLALYISFFPQLVAGPIVRYSTIAEQIRHRTCTPGLFAEGTKRFFLGFSKKVLLANNLSLVVTDVFANDATITNPLLLWIGAICYTLQIFYDFSGYSDMAIGLGKMFGFTFEENFNYPYISKSVTEFWRRWHISLGQWFRDYVYIPLGGSKCSVPRHILNLLVVWLLTGIWHGANTTFIVWGLGYFVLLVIEKFIVKPEKRKNKALRILWQIFTLLAVNFGWVMFTSATVASGIQYCLAMIGHFHVAPAIDAHVVMLAREYGIFFILGIFFATPVAKYLGEKVKKTRFAGAAQIIVPIGYGLVFLWSVSYLILGAHNPFIYFNF